jgi:hypothetical protein
MSFSVSLSHADRRTRRHGDIIIIGQIDEKMMEIEAQVGYSTLCGHAAEATRLGATVEVS